jgi:Carboxypeptidase regulatory-like domain/TonB-dependent Receptor Plug Domain
LRIGAGIRLCYALLWVVLAAVPHASAADLSGIARDATGGTLANARIVVMTAQRAVVATTHTDASGKFSVTGLPDGAYVIAADFASLGERQTAVALSGSVPVSIELVLERVTSAETVSVTATPAAVADLSRTSQPVNVVGEDEVLLRAKTVVAQAIEGETGVHLQRTSPGMAGSFVRGLTGNKVNIFVDGRSHRSATASPDAASLPSCSV